MYTRFDAINNELQSGNDAASTFLIKSDYIVQLAKENEAPPQRKDVPPEAIFHGEVDENTVILVLPWSRIVNRVSMLRYQVG